MNDPLSPAAKFNTDVRNLVILGVLIAGLVIFFWVIGKTDRVTYLGPDHRLVTAENQVSLKTEPDGNYVIERNAIYAAMKAGCRYDLNYPPVFGRSRSASNTRGRARHIRSAALVDCP